MIILGIESTAHTFGIGIVKSQKAKPLATSSNLGQSNGKIIANVKDAYTTEKGGIIPIESAKHHERVADKLYERALSEAKINGKDINAIAFSQGPGLSPCLLVGLRKAKELSKKLNVPLVPVNHCVAHLEIGRITGAKDPVLLYVSGANTQVIAYASGKYRIFGETLDLGVGNFIDTFARYLDLGFPGGPKVEQLAKQSNNYIELPYTVKGMDIALSGILTNLRQKIGRMDKHLQEENQVSCPHPHAQNLHSSSIRDINGSDPDIRQGSSLKDNINPKNLIKLTNKSTPMSPYINPSNNLRAERDNLKEKNINYTKQDLAFSMQETVFAMLVEVAERALAHTGKKELLLGGGVACNSRLQEMCRIMCEERGAKMFAPSRDLLVDNGAMIGFLGEVIFKSGIKFTGKKAEKLDIKPRERTDDVTVSWK